MTTSNGRAPDAWAPDRAASALDNVKGRRRCRRPESVCVRLERDDEFPAVTGVDSHHQSHRIPAPTVRASDARTVSAHERRARVLFTIDPLRAKSGSRRIGGRAVSCEIPGFASPPRDGFALSDRGVQDESPLCSHCGSSIPECRYPSSTSTLSPLGGVVGLHRAARAARAAPARSGADGRRRCDRGRSIPGAHGRDDHDADTDADQHVADAEDIGERDPRR